MARRDLHWLDENGMVACNPRDPEAVHRAEKGKLLVGRHASQVTCRKCQVVIAREREVTRHSR